MKLNQSIKLPTRRTCIRCGFVASQEICKACTLLEGLNTGNPKLGVGKSNKAKRSMGLTILDGSEKINKKKVTEFEESKRKKKRDISRRKKAENRLTSRLKIEGNLCESCKASMTQDLNSKDDKNYNERIDYEDNDGDVDDDDDENLFNKKTSCEESCKSNCGSSYNVSSLLKEDNTETIEVESIGSKNFIDVNNGAKISLTNADYCQETLSDLKGESFELKGFNQDFSNNLLNSVLSDDLPLPTYVSSDEENLISKNEGKEEKVVCKCPPQFRAFSKTKNKNTQKETEKWNIQKSIQKEEKMGKKSNKNVTSQSLPDLEDDELYEGDGTFNFKLYCELINFNIEEEMEKLSTDEELETSIDTNSSSKTESFLKKQENKKASYHLGYSEARSSSTTIETSDSIIKPASLTKNKSRELITEIKKLDITADDFTEDQATVVKANPKRVGPAVLLPEMIHKTKNNLDF